MTLDGYSYRENGEKTGFPTFVDHSVIRPMFLEVSLATKVVELKKSHRNANFPEVCGDFG